MDTDQNGSFDPLRDPVAAASWATPFPDFDRDGDWQPKAAAHDITIDYIRRLVEAEQ